MRTVVLLIVLSSLLSFETLGNAYVIIYASLNGKTGHAGIAIDNYSIENENNVIDTIANGTLTYYDFWPADGFGLSGFSKNCPAKFYKLPDRIWSSAITVNSLYDKGIPHREHYPCDAILMFNSTPSLDFHAHEYINSIIKSNRRFNPRYYNCGDFVVDILRLFTGKIYAKEFVPFSFTTTPNKLCRKIMKQEGVTIIKSPGVKVKRNFFIERILKSHRDNEDKDS